MTLELHPYHQRWQRKVNRTIVEGVCWRTLKLPVSPTASSPLCFASKAKSSERAIKCLPSPSYLQAYQISWKFSLLSKPYSIKANLISRDFWIAQSCNDSQRVGFASCPG